MRANTFFVFKIKRIKKKKKKKKNQILNVHLKSQEEYAAAWFPRFELEMIICQ